jgi:hypothetical protein
MFLLLFSWIGLVLNLLGWVGLVLGLLCEPKEDPRFEGDKLIYRS